MRNRSGLGVAVLVAVSVLGAACADAQTDANTAVPSQRPTDDHGASHDQPAAAPAPVEGRPEVTITAIDIDFIPASLTLDAGHPTNVTVVNEGAAFHDFTLEAAGIHLNLEPGHSQTTSIDLEPGTYEAKCTVPGHAEAGMTIAVTVS